MILQFDAPQAQILLIDKMPPWTLCKCFLFYFHVFSSMCRKVTLSTNVFPQFSHIGVLSRVCPLMFNKAILLAEFECLSTHITLMLFLSSVCPLMCHKNKTMTEGLSTHNTLIWFIASVCFLMSQKARSLAK